MSTEKSQSKAKQFLFGGISGMAATCVVQPIDLIKTRMQLTGEGGKQKEYKNSFDAVKNIAKKEGIYNLYKGLSAGLLRQATYTTARLGFYDYIFTTLTKYNDGKPLPFYQKALAGMTAGGFGAIIGTPAEVALIRMTSDGRLPPEQRRGYKNAFDALLRMSREEGVLTLWRGCVPTILRAMILNAAQLSTYSQAKQMLIGTGYFSDNMMTHFSASTISGFIATAVSMPVDIAKTRIQTQKYVDGVPEYKNAVDCIAKTARKEGVFKLWAGFTPYFLRLGPHTILTFIILEQLKRYF